MVTVDVTVTAAGEVDPMSEQEPQQVGAGDGEAGQAQQPTGGPLDEPVVQPLVPVGDDHFVARHAVGGDF